MVVIVEARKLNLPPSLLPSSSSYASSVLPPAISLLYDSNSLSLALMHSDSSVSLYPSFSPFSISSSFIPQPQTLIPSPSSSTCFIHLKLRRNSPTSRVVFLAAGSHKGDTKLVLRFYILSKNQKFLKAQVNCGQSGLKFDSKVGVIIDGNHGAKVLLSGSLNYFAMYSSSAGKIWIFGLKLVGNVDDGSNLRLVKCAVIDCCFPILAVSISMGYLILEELNGVRLFPLRKLVKGRGKKKDLVGRQNGTSHGGLKDKVQSEGRNSKLPNGLVKSCSESYELDKKSGLVLKVKADGHVAHRIKRVSSNGLSVSSAEEKNDSVKLHISKLRQDSGDWGACFLPFSSSMVEGLNCTNSQDFMAKTAMVQAISQNRFLIVDPNGNLHSMHVSSSGVDQVTQLTGTMQVQQLAVLPDTSNSSQTVWLSDGFHSVHVMEVSEAETSSEENDGSTSEGKFTQAAVIAAIFTAGKIQDIAPLSAGAVLILGQDSLYAYAIS